MQAEFDASKQLGLALFQDTRNLSGHSIGGMWMATFPKARTCCLCWAERFDSAVQCKITPGDTEALC